MALTFEQAFGPNAFLDRHRSGENPFVIFEGSPNNVTAEWKYNPESRSFDRYDKIVLDYSYDESGGKHPVLFGLSDKPTATVNASDLGLSKDPAYEIAGLATLSGKNQDPWSNYALTRNDYGGGVGSASSVMNGVSDLRNSISDIQSYEAGDPWDAFMEKAWMVPLTVAAAAAIPGLGYTPGATEGLEATKAATGALEAAEAGTVGSTSGSTTGGYFGGVGGQSAAMPGLQSFGAAAGSSAIPEIGIGSALGSSAAPSLFGAGELASLFPAAYALTAADAASAAGPLSTALKTAKTASQVKSIGDMLESGDYLDAAKTVGGKLLGSAPAIGTLLGALSDDGSGQTIGGQGGAGGAGGSAAWMNQALPTINIPAYRSNVIQGDPYRYGMGAEQALYTDQSGNLPRAQNFGTSGGRPFGVQYNFEQAPAQSGGLASIQPAIQSAVQPAMQQPARQALTQQDVTSYLSSKGLDLTPEGVQRGLAIYNSENPNSQLTQSDIGAAFGYTPEQSSAWMYEGQTKAPSVLEAQNWYKNQYAPTQTQSGGLASIQPSIQPTTQPAPAPAPVQATAKPALTQQDVTAYLAANNLNLDPSGVSTALAHYNGTIGDPSKQYSVADVGAAFGYTPEQSRAWMQGQKFAEGGAVGGYNCGGLSQAFDREEEDENERYVDGDGGGQDDDVEARVSSGEYVFDADVVSALGDGNNEAGARILDELRAKIRQHKRAAPANKIPPKAKSIEQYLKEVR